MKKSTVTVDKAIRKDFERYYSRLDLDKYTDLECLILSVPSGTYKDGVTQSCWVAYNPWLASKPGGMHK